MARLKRSKAVKRSPWTPSTTSSSSAKSAVSDRYSSSATGSHTQWSVCGTWLMYFSSAPSAMRMPSGNGAAGVLLRECREEGRARYFRVDEAHAHVVL